ncbi:hypothetical protein L593_07565 [Salinarchaeum sp. Harcht-Bsk1]|uniref:TM2 domain-containing protein n=1 Tax=Salinarchaeum sp. Harcht-Bsk1 TaxID=1333523 RepID=UPI00034236C6|nr:TM2 domain-containing protein [Salinarchaeum sp. Harcht-Bsk1]AGN01458.1 hypothetical protein L593_07565 [Salinarchaeum sp. Harcht-Bsk1]
MSNEDGPEDSSGDETGPETGDAGGRDDDAGGTDDGGEAAGASAVNGGDGDTPGADDAGTDDDRETPGPDEQYCASCGEIIERRAEICPHCGVRNRNAPSTARTDRTTAGILAILLGGIGAHKFYLGETGLGILYLCFVWTGIPVVIGIIEGILYLTKTDEEFERKYLDE